MSNTSIFPDTSLINYEFAKNNIPMKIEELVFPENIQFIGPQAFRLHNDIKSIVFGSKFQNVGDEAFAYKPKLTYAEFKSCVTIGRFAFYDSPLETVVLPQNLKVIDNHAFANNRNLTKITLPNDIERIGAFAFFKTNIKEVYIPNSIQSIGLNAFVGIFNDITLKMTKNTYDKIKSYDKTFNEPGVFGVKYKIEFVELALEDLLSQGKTISEINQIYKMEKDNYEI